MEKKKNKKKKHMGLISKGCDYRPKSGFLNGLSFV